jgi:hypothetical protein
MIGSMERSEFAKIAVAIKAAYPASKILEDDASRNFWYMMLKDMPYDIAENAVTEHICTNVYPPNIAEIRKLCTERCKPAVLSFDEAWGVVQKAISRYGWNYPDKAFEKMDQLTLSVVKNIGWTRLCQSENPTADRANFREAYEAKARKIQSEYQLPQFVADKKAMLKEKYVHAIESKGNIEIEDNMQNEVIAVEELTPEQIEKRDNRFKEIRRRLMNGNV